MLDRLFAYKVHDFLHILGISLLAFGLPMNKVLMSIGAIWGVSNLVLEGNVTRYWKNIKQNRLFLLLLSFCALHLLGFFWTTNYDFALHDLRVKLPLLIIPLALVARPITDRKQIHIILIAFLTGLFITSCINFGSYFNWFGNKTYLDVRGMSLFGSHIRYGLLIATGIAISIYFISQNKRIWWILLTLIAWFSIYTYYSQVLSGVLALMAVAVFSVLYFSFKFNKWVGISLIALISALLFTLPFQISPKKHLPIQLETLSPRTKEGNPYKHDLKSAEYENNRPVDIYIAEVELDREWSQVSTYPLDSLDRKGQQLKRTLLRYMTSKDLRKDAQGVHSLSKEDIQNIENGIGSIELAKEGLMSRFSAIKYQLNNTHDPNGHSLLQRFESWKTGWHIAKDNWFIGVGTGDIGDKFDVYYENENSLLLPENRLRTHNMYLTIWITFGIVGLLLFLWLFFAFFTFNWQQQELVPLLFFAIVFSTFFIEDTIETQMGITYFSLFMGLFMQKIHPTSKLSK
jgi:hypothetical protein